MCLCLCLFACVFVSHVCLPAILCVRVILVIKIGTDMSKMASVLVLRWLSGLYASLQAVGSSSWDIDWRQVMRLVYTSKTSLGGVVLTSAN